MPEHTFTTNQLRSLVEASRPDQAPNQENVFAGYRATSNQALFFFLVWASKQKNACDVSEQCLNCSTVVVENKIKDVLQYLDLCGQTVTGLRQKEEKEWELLRIVLEKMARSQTGHNDARVEAVGNAMVKLLRILQSMPDSDLVEHLDAPFQFVAENRDQLKGIYDFSSPFYRYAGVVARNFAVSYFRKRNNKNDDSESFDDILSIKEAPAHTLEDKVWEAEYEMARQKYHERLQYLLDTIHSSLTPKPTQVILYTLAARPQFWMALEETQFPIPDYLPPQNSLHNDQDIAEALNLDVNRVRVHRAKAKNRISEIDPDLGRWLKRLIARSSH